MDPNSVRIFVLADEEHRNFSGFLNVAQRPVHAVSVVGGKPQSLFIWHLKESSAAALVGNIGKSVGIDCTQEEVGSSF